MSKHIPAFFLMPLCLLLAGCATKSPTYNGSSYPATTHAQVIFQDKDVPKQCSVLAQLIVHTPTGQTGAAIGERITGFAEGKGADLILIGLSRRTSDDPGSDFAFFSYGPASPYKFNKDWLGWKYGYADWQKAGSVIGFGYDSWHDATGILDSSLKIQAILLRCDESAPIKEK